jgi:hypothetical protein
MRKSPVEVGDKFGKLVVIGHAASDSRGNQRVVVRCSCSQRTEKTVRLSGLTFLPYTDNKGKARKPYRSCGCESKLAYLEYLESRARGIRKKVKREIWVAHQSGMRFHELARQFSLPSELVSAICRLYNQRGPAPVAGAIPRGSKALKEPRATKRVNAITMLDEPS